MNITLTNCTVSKIKAALHHNNEGSIAHESDSVSGKYIYAKLREDGTPTFESEVGYTEKQTMIQNGRMLLNTEIEWDFTNGGSNTGVDALLNSWKYGILTGLENIKHYFKVVKDENENVIGTKEHYILSQAQTGNCKTKTDKYFGVYQPIINELITNINGEQVFSIVDNQQVTTLM